MSKINSVALFLLSFLQEEFRAAGNHDETDFMSEQEALRQKLVGLELEHRDLDDVIARLTERAPYDQLQLQRLKKRKLVLKDQISHVEAELLPDIIA